MARKQQEKAQQTRTEILESAEKLFVKFGFVATTVAQITMDAGYAKGNFYRHWLSKDDLMLEIIANKIRCTAVEGLVLIFDDIRQRGCFLGHGQGVDLKFVRSTRKMENPRVMI